VSQAEEQNEKKFYETIVENTQRGDLYRVKFKNNNTIYLGIPVICATCEDEERLNFPLRSLNPGGKRISSPNIFLKLNICIEPDQDRLNHPASDAIS